MKFALRPLMAVMRMAWRSGMSVLPVQEEDNSCLVKAFYSLFFTVLRSL